jgi:hypothetical protein
MRKKSYESRSRGGWDVVSFPACACLAVVVCGVDQSTTSASIKILTGCLGSRNTIQNNDKRKAAARMVVCGLQG